MILCFKRKRIWIWLVTCQITPTEDVLISADYQAMVPAAENALVPKEKNLLAILNAVSIKIAIQKS